MKPEIKKAIQTELNQKVKEALESSDFFEKLKLDEIPTLKNENIAGGKYKLHKATQVVIYSLDENTEERTLTIKNPKWETPYHVSEENKRLPKKNLSMFYFTGDLSEIKCTWKYDEDGELHITTSELIIDTNFEKKRSN